MNKLYKIILISFLFITILLVCINKFEKETFVNIVKPTNKIVIFYHICELGNWDQIVNEQLGCRPIVVSSPIRRIKSCLVPSAAVYTRLA